MRRLQILFALFAIALIAPVGLLVQRSLESIALERRTRQQAVAERIFDEMERSLSGLLEREEVRPIEGYEQAGSGADAAFVVSRFQVDAETAPAQLAARPGEGGPLINRVLPPADALDAEIARYFRGSRSSVEEAEARDLQAPGTTVRLNGDLDEKKEASSKGAKRKQNVSEYDALRSLNKALEERVVGRARAPSRREVEATPPQAGLDDDAPRRPRRCSTCAPTPSEWQD